MILEKHCNLDNKLMLLHFIFVDFHLRSTKLLFNYILQIDSQK